jgi:hypothetical protein
VSPSTRCATPTAAIFFVTANLVRFSRSVRASSERATTWLACSRQRTRHSTVLSAVMSM